MLKVKHHIGRLSLVVAAILCLLAIHLSATFAHAQDTICATVKVEIQQTFAFERQAFDAKMVITNGLSEFAIQDVAVTVNFTDEFGNQVEATSNPNNETAKFFITVSSLTNIDNVSGTGVIAPSTAAQINWLIIPAPSAAGGTLSGKLYFVGATVDYSVNGQSQTFEAAEDFIVVKPQPEFELDYFLPVHVYGDDPLTPAIEPIIPFTLGVRVKNVGLAPANNTSIQSSQPVIVENSQGLLVNFEILSSFVDNQPAQPTLLLDFGTVEASSSRMGRWNMQTTLAGQFVSFGATFTHADELGGELTSLLNSVNTHQLIKDVLVDLPGRDGVLDFLAISAGVKKVFESNGLDSLVTDQSGFATLIPNGSANGIDSYYIDLPATAGMLYVSVPDPYNGIKAVHSVSRSDGKILPSQNGWFAREGTGGDSTYWLRLFDVNGGGRYFIDVGNPIAAPAAPIVVPVPNYSMAAGGKMTFLVFGNDPAGSSPTMSVDALPLGASFVDFPGYGIGLFAWDTGVNQLGTYPVTFRATAGGLSGAHTAYLKVLAPGGGGSDSDNDGMLDAWELFHFGTLERNGLGDFDGDGLTDLEEHLLGLDPTTSANAPTVPVISSPLFGHTVTETRPNLVVKNSVHGVQIPTYEFQLSTNRDFTSYEVGTVNQGTANGVTTWQVPEDLTEDTPYYWRARASLAQIASEWVYGEFFVNAINHPPTPPHAVYPIEGEVVDSRLVQLTVANSYDPENQELSYSFEISDSSLPIPQVHTVAGIKERSSGFTTATTEIPADLIPPYSWRAIATDPEGAIAESEAETFKVRYRGGTRGKAPSPPLPLAPIADSIVSLADGNSPLELVVKRAHDPDSRRARGRNGGRYIFELSSDPKFATILESAELRAANPVIKHQISAKLTENTRYFWRARAFDGSFWGRWAYASFVVNSQNDAPLTPVPANPERFARVDTLAPTLNLFPSSDPDLLPGVTAQEIEALTYEVQVFSDPGMSEFVAKQSAQSPNITLSTPLTNHKKYYWRARSYDLAGESSGWSEASAFFVSKDPSNDQPFVQVVAPASKASYYENEPITIRWVDYDSDSDATLTLSINGEPYKEFVRTTALDGDNDIFTLPPYTFTPGEHQITLSASDGVTTVVDEECCNLTILAADLTVDSDGDGVPDHLDNCPYTYNPDQSDRGGVLASGPDGIGDSCQCADFSGDGRVNLQDFELFAISLRPTTKAGLPNLELCNLTGHPACSSEDLQLLRQLLGRKQTASSKKKKTKRQVTLPAMCEAAVR